MIEAVETHIELLCFSYQLAPILYEHKVAYQRHNHMLLGPRTKKRTLERTDLRLLNYTTDSMEYPSF